MATKSTITTGDPLPAMRRTLPALVEAVESASRSPYAYERRLESSVAIAEAFNEGARWLGAEISEKLAERGIVIRFDVD